MNQRNLNRINMWRVVLVVLRDNQDLWDGTPAFVNAVATLDSYVAAAGQTAVITADGSEGITENKLSLADKAIELTTVVTNLARAYARQNDKMDLMNAVDYSKGRLQKTPLDELEPRLTSMLNAALSVKTELANYGLKPGADSVAQTAIKEFLESVPDTRSAITTQTSLNKGMAAINRGARSELMTIDDLMTVFLESHPAFVARYRAARIIIDSGIRHEDGSKDADTPSN